MKKIKTTLSVVSALMLLCTVFSCEKRDSTDLELNIPVYQELLVRYQMNQKETVAEATLRTIDEKGTRLELKGDSKILCNGKPPQRFNLIFNSHGWKVKGLVDAEFIYTKSDSKSFKNKISFEEAETIEIPASFASVTLDGKTKLKWSGASLGKNEQIIVSLQQAGNGATEIIKGTELLEFDKVFVGKMEKGKAILTVTRRKKLDGFNQSDGINNGQRIVEVEIFKEIEVK